MSTMVLPVVRETYAEHFVNNGWASPSDQVAAGYERFIQPNASTALFEKTVDIGALIESQSLISLEIAREDIVGEVTITPTLSVSEDNITFTDYEGQISLYLSNFRYIKVSLAAATSTDKELVRIRQIKLVVYLREQTDQGTGEALASDTDGTVVTLNKSFIDVSSIVISAKHQPSETKGITPMYSFTDVINPTSFKVLLFSNLTGGRIDGDFSWIVKGT